MKSRITLKDLAEKMNLSVSTISRALHNHPSIGVKTTEEVKQMALKVGYFPNTLASNLRTNKTQSIAVIVPRIDVHFHSRAISGIEEVAYKAGYNVTIYQSDNSLEREVSISKIIHASMAEGLIVCLGIESDSTEHYDIFKRRETPMVFFDRVPEDLTDVNKVMIDDFDAAKKATKHLISIGCKKIAHIAGNQSTSIFRKRLEGYKAALHEHNLPINNNWITFTKNLSYHEGMQCAQKFLSKTSKPDGLFCANDYTAISAIQTFLKNDIKVPQDIAVVGFSNYPMSEFIEPTLSTIDDRAYEMGQTAAKLLIRQINESDPIFASESVVLQTKLIQRKSTHLAIHIDERTK